jgi:hypothetical protein
MQIVGSGRGDLMTTVMREVVVCELPKQDAFTETPVQIRYHRNEMSKVAVPKSKSARKVPRKSARIILSTRRRRSKAEDRLDGMAAMKALKESAERIPYQKARRDLDL